MKQSKCRLPNALITDQRLSYADRRVGLSLFAFRNALGCSHKSYAELGHRAGCSAETARKAVQRLSKLGYIKYDNTYRYDASHGVVYAKNEYYCDLSILDRGYTIVSRDVFSHEMPHSTFIILMTVYMEMGNTGRAFPSISILQKITGAVRSTVCAGLRLIRSLHMILIQLCRKRNGAFGASSYFQLRQTAATSRHLKKKININSSHRSVLLQYIIDRGRCLLQKAKIFLQSFGKGVVRFLANYVRT